MPTILTIISILLISTGCRTNQFNEINTQKSGQLISTHNKANFFLKRKQKENLNKYDVNNRAYKAKITIDKLCQKRENLRKKNAINNIHERSKSLAIIKTLELMTKSERAYFLRIYESGNNKNSIRSLLSKEFKHSYLRKKASALIEEASIIQIINERIIISDLDNTIKPTNDSTIDGYVYPGAVKLLNALDQKNTGDVHIVTARPFGARNSLNSARIQYNSVSYGNVCGIAAWLLGFHNPIKERKIENIRRIMNRNTESNVILIGDDGQADAEVYLQIMREYPERVEAALIHNVIGKKLPKAFSANPNSIIYNNFADAAASLHSKGIINKIATEEIINALHNN